MDEKRVRPHDRELGEACCSGSSWQYCFLKMWEYCLSWKDLVTIKGTQPPLFVTETILALASA